MTMALGTAFFLSIVWLTVVALAATRLMTTLLYGIAATDPITFVSICLVIGTIALIASYVPARRATRVDPLEALRYE